MTSGVFFANGYGDYVINRPALAALATVLPRPARLVCSRGAHEFLVTDLGFDEVIALPIKTEADGRSFDIQAAAARLGRCDVFVDLTPWPTSKVPALAEMVCARHTIGYRADYHVEVARDFTKNAVELAFDVALAVDASLHLQTYRKPPMSSSKARQAVEQLEQWKRRAGVTRLLAVHADTFPHKTWSAEGFRRIIRSVLDQERELGCVIVGHQPPPLMMQGLSDRMVVLQGFSLESSMAVVASAEAFLGIDSCMLHAADSAGVPGTLLFGPHTSPTTWGYYWTSGTHLRFADQNDLTIVDTAIAALSAHLANTGRGC